MANRDTHASVRGTGFTDDARLPNLGELVADPGTIARIPATMIPDLLRRLGMLQDALVRRLEDALETASKVDGQAGLGEEYLSVRQLATRVPYAESTIRNLMSSGVLREGTHYFKRRGRVMFSWSGMRDWLEETGDGGKHHRGRAYGR
jgi:hypothetical protein